jgi:hypothetical protein
LPERYLNILEKNFRIAKQRKIRVRPSAPSKTKGFSFLGDPFSLPKIRPAVPNVCAMALPFGHLPGYQARSAKTALAFKHFPDFGPQLPYGKRLLYEI